MGCGPQNPHGLQLVVYRDGDTVYSDVTFDDRHIGTPAVTRSLTVEYLRPVQLHQPHRLSAHIASREGRVLNVIGTGTGSDGITRFTASAVFITVGTDHFATHGDVSGFGELLERFAATAQITPDSPIGTP
jgi:hypothetical protein